ncbi:alpha-amylase family glycosyl hydrolase [Leptolyngbya ohadii]|uniref:alpha-amylase family glycosyl hydrolase n=1 Tax=Leptolyngbya ohadii TaxID=1962290 RepID=UPI000B599089|nr:alpha-amylase family glycosyl hydrolase [Leptolyngbya ohadii]
MVKSLYDPAVDDVLNPPTQVPGSNFPPSTSFHPSPADWRDLWIYFLLVDRFNHPSAPPNPNDYPCNVYQGGKLAGIKQQLPYLKDLGVGAIWLSPVLMNPQWFKDYWGGYGILDFLRIEPRFCTDEAGARQDPAIADQEFRDLVDAAHAQGIYVILDIVLNHVYDAFNYEGMRDAAPWNPNREYTVYWRNEDGIPQGNWTAIEKIQNLAPGAGVWPTEFQRNDYFRRRGDNNPNDSTQGDFYRLKELVTEYLIPGTNLYPVRNHLIRAYQYLIAKFDLDGFRIDTLQYVEADFARVFGNAMREFALSIGKKNFFTFGEVWQDDNEEKIAEFVGRNTHKDDELIGVDAAIDFPVRKRLVNAVKGFAPPSDLANHLDYRRQILRKYASSHGDASGHYITFLDNHDLNERFHNKAFPDQTKLALTCLMTLQGIPCIYYGTEQGLDGHGDRREYVREALWGRQNAFSPNHELYKHIQELSKLRDEQPALRYGRQYFRKCSGDGMNFSYSPYKGGVIAYSRILNDKELLIVANTSTQQSNSVYVVVDANLNPVGKSWKILFSTQLTPTAPSTSKTHGTFHTVQITLKPMEVQVLG